jgi:pyrroloquinoline quinone biosynthesis protein E
MNNTPRPYTLVAELTYRCPLRCLYCSNPLDFAAYFDELSTEQWRDVFSQAARLGVVQLHLSGGEPAVRDDLSELIRYARDNDLYTNLITGGTLLDEDRLRDLRDAGLEHIQLSMQGASDTSAFVVGARHTSKKMRVADSIVRLEIPLTINVVVHRYNLNNVRDLIREAYEIGAQRLELANVQYYGWAFQNRRTLMPHRKQYKDAERIVQDMIEEYRGAMEIVFVGNDYLSGEPKPCMGGWAQSYICIDPTGAALPCHAARVIRTLRFDNVRTHRLEHIWNYSEAFLAFRGEEWMRDPCRSCPRKSFDHGGCRCQAFMLTGDARSADPVCHKSEHHSLVENWIGDSPIIEPIYRQVSNSRRL